MKILAFIFIILFIALAVVIIAQWTWSIFCPIFGFREMTFLEMLAFLTFVGICLSPVYKNSK